MKKIIAMVAAAFVAASAFAYDISLGGRINTNISLFDFSQGDSDYFEDYDIFPACGFGAVALVNVSDLTDAVPGLGVQIEFGFANETIAYKDKDEDAQSVGGSVFSLQIPILVTYKYDINDKFYVQGELGPRLSFLTNGASYAYKLDGPFQFGIAVGGVVGVNITDRTAVTFGARYNRDFTKVKGHEDSGFDKEFGSNQFIDLSAGVVFKM